MREGEGQEEGVGVIKSWLPQGNSNLFHYIYRSLMVTDPKEMVASNCPWPFVRKKEIMYDYRHRPKKKETHNNNSIHIITEIIIGNLFILFSMLFFS